MNQGIRFGRSLTLPSRHDHFSVSSAPGTFGADWLASSALSGRGCVGALCCHGARLGRAGGDREIHQGGGVRKIVIGAGGPGESRRACSTDSSFSVVSDTHECLPCAFRHYEKIVFGNHATKSKSTY